VSVTAALYEGHFVFASSEPLGWETRFNASTDSVKRNEGAQLRCLRSVR
jgi:hypothetical protein